jgi:hypothetical protein
MAVQHGITTTILPSATTPIADINAGLPVCIGAVPNWQIDGIGASGLLGPFYSMAEFRAVCGWSVDYDRYPGCEAADVFFNLYNVGPLIIINPLDPVADGTAITPAVVALVGGVYTIAANDIVLSTLVVKSADGVTTYAEGDDYTAAYDADFNVVITRVAEGTIPAATSEIQLNYKTVTDSALAAADIVTFVAKVDEIFPKLRLTPGQLLAPGWSDNATVAAALTAKANAINVMFGCIALTDIPTDTVTSYSTVAAWISTNSYTDGIQVNCWPLVTLGGVKYHLSTHIAALNCLTDSSNADIPYNSPSNRALSIDGACLADDTAVWLGPETFTAAEVPFVTAINFLEWTAWGNRTGAFAASTDALTFIPNMRMTQWMRNKLTLTFWRAVDRPINMRLVDTIVDSANQWYNGLTARGAILGGRCEVQRALNSDLDLAGGKLTVSYYNGFSSPARLIEQQLQLDASYFGTLFS